MLSRLLLLVALSLPVWATPPEELFVRGNEFADKKQYRRALECYKQALEQAPNEPSLLNNAAQSAYFLGDGNEALRLWTELSKLEPNNWRIRTKIIQCHQLLGNTAARQREEQALVALWKSGADKELAQQDAYTMDQFMVGHRRVLTRVPFVPNPERRVVYKFLISKPDSDELEEYYLSLGTYELTTQFGLESGHLKRGQRYFHLDEYSRRGHATHAMVVDQPPYETVRGWVQEIVAGNRKPILRSSW